MTSIVIVMHVLVAGVPPPSHYVLRDQNFIGFCGPTLHENSLILERTFLKSFIITSNRERRDRKT